MLRLAAGLALLSSACSMTAESRTGTTVAGLALGVAGAVMMKDSVVDADRDGVNEYWLDDNLGEQLGGVLVMTAGAALLLAAVTAHEPERAPEPLQPVASAAPLPTAYEPARLPELPASPTVIRLAQQVRSLAADEQCHPAWATWRQLAAVDQAYATAALKSDLMGPCTGFERAAL